MICLVYFTDLVLLMVLILKFWHVIKQTLFAMLSILLYFVFYLFVWKLDAESEKYHERHDSVDS